MSTPAHNRKPNSLINEKSPYLLQHAYNPVDWFAWGTEAFEKAKRENKPIFLSIGYSTCHWCHVMERESFEDDEVAALINQNFVAIKVDREERPDVDHIYMSVCQALTGQGGWPLTVIMTPDQKPFFAGTYFPKDRRYGRPGLMDILTQISEKWTHDHQQILDTGERIVEHLSQHLEETTLGPASSDPTSARIMEKAVRLYREQFDSAYGGFGQEPKFPSPHNLMFLLRHGKKQGDQEAISMVETTLDAMYSGGIYDHVGFGFARYSVDRKWLVPHFEKMLYDNALLAMAYLEAYQATGKNQYAGVVEDIFSYVLRDMTSPEGGFYSAEDADSEGEEGKFYVWTPEEVKQVLGSELGSRYCRYYDITEHGNFEGHNIPNLIGQSLEAFAKAEGIDPHTWEQQAREANRALFLHREKRIHPYKDDKILTAWNGLMIAALAKAAKVLQKAEYRVAAQKAADFVTERLVNEDGRLLARYRDGEAAFLAYLDDYAFLVCALIELYEATFDESYLQKALQFNQSMIDLFWDDKNGGFFFYGLDGEALIARPKEIYDGAMPSGNSVAALNLLRLAKITGDTELDRLAERQIQAFTADVERYPIGYSYFLMALQFAVGPTQEIVIAGDPQKEDTKHTIAALQQLYLPFTVTLFHPENDPDRAEAIEALAEYVKAQRSLEGKATVYICENYACQAPKTDLQSVLEQLGAK